jgi:hypothetical protein
VRTPILDSKTSSLLPDEEQFLAEDSQGDRAAAQFV